MNKKEKHIDLFLEIQKNGKLPCMLIYKNTIEHPVYIYHDYNNKILLWKIIRISCLNAHFDDGIWDNVSTKVFSV